jgi:hypothetical protein
MVASNFLPLIVAVHDPAEHLSFVRSVFRQSKYSNEREVSSDFAV